LREQNRPNALCIDVAACMICDYSRKQFDGGSDS
jgi:hypothetical protein